MKKVLKWGGIAFIALIAIGVVTSMGNSGSNQNSNTNNSGTQQQEQTQAKEPEIIEASTLVDAFDANQVAAESEWKGKYVQFSSEITNITDSGLSFSKAATKEFSLAQISCKIKDKQQLLSVKNGETVTVKGTVGGQTIGVIDFSDCEIVK